MAVGVKGKPNKDWKKAKPYNKEGYIYRSFNGKNYPEHHLVYCAYHNLTAIPKGYQIHHINGDKTDNRIDNLELLSISDHIRLHNKINYPKGSLLGKNLKRRAD